MTQREGMVFAVPYTVAGLVYAGIASFNASVHMGGCIALILFGVVLVIYSLGGILARRLCISLRNWAHGDSENELGGFTEFLMIGTWPVLSPLIMLFYIVAGIGSRI